jgi:AraC-like DNA-binding protein
VKSAVFHPAVNRAKDREPLVIDVAHERSGTRVVACTAEAVPRIVVEAAFSGANVVSCVCVRDDHRQEFSAATLDSHPALATVLRLIGEEAEWRCKVTPIWFRCAELSAVNHAENRHVESDALLESLFHSVLLYAARAGVDPTLPRWGRSVRDRHIERALMVLNSDIAKRWTVQWLAKTVGLSRPVFARRFLAALGVSPMCYLTSRRMQVAAALLFSSDAGLADIAARVGYESEFAFSRAFKRHYHVAPGQYRRRGAMMSNNVVRMAA